MRGTSSSVVAIVSFHRFKKPKTAQKATMAVI
jgi:hypothetical protein